MWLPKIKIDNLVAFDSDWHSPLRYEKDSDYRTGVNLAH